MPNEILYKERISSHKTEALFVALTLIFSLLFIWRVAANGLELLALVLLAFAGLFLFYSLNYRTLVIQLTSQALKLTFGVFTWKVPLDNVAQCALDEIPPFMKYGGAGIHFMNIRHRYRASFNFLEYPRIVIEFKEKVGPVRDISFSTRHPDQVLHLIQQAVAEKQAA